MQKEDVQWAVLGILILLVIALVIKPMATGQPVNVGLPTQKPTPDPTPSPNPLTTIPLVRAPPTPSSTPLPTPTTLPTLSTTIQFVDPATYGLKLIEDIPSYSNISGDNATWRSALVSCSKIAGKYSGTTQSVFIPYPYWELWYTADPVSSELHKTTGISSYSVTQAPGSGISSGGVQGSYSTVMPKLSIQVMDADDPNRIVRTISPPGGIDPALFSKTFAASNASSRTPGKYEQPDKTETADITDPRPWKEKFYEGKRSYYFVIRSAALSSYQLEIMTFGKYVNASVFSTRQQCLPI